MKHPHDFIEEEIILNKGDKITFEGLEDKTLLHITVRKYNEIIPRLLITTHTEGKFCSCPECRKKEKES